MKRDWTIEASRFLATCGIAVFHFEWIYLGHPVYFQHFYLWVEFFFALSGFFLAKNAIGNHDKSIFEPIKYVKRQAIKLWKPYIIAFIFSFIVYCIVNEIRGFNNIASTFFSAKWEILFLHLSGFDSGAPIINGVTAYIPALLVSSIIVYYLIKRHYALLVNIIIPIVPIFIYSHMINTYGNLSQWLPYENWYTIGILRGLAGILIGAGAYIYGIKVFPNLQLSSITRKMESCLLGIIGITAIFALVFFRNSISFSDEVIYPYIFSILLGLLFFRQRRKVVQDTIIEKIILRLGKISYNIFLIHYGICFLFFKYCSGKSYISIVPWYMLIVLLGGIIMDIFLTNMKHIASKS